MIQPTSELDMDLKPFDDVQEDSSGDIFVGREEQLDQLLQQFKKSCEGAGNLVVITGEAGTGKRQLVKHFAAGVKHPDVMFVSESYQGVPSYEPYRPFWKIVRQLSQSIHAGTESALAQEWAGHPGSSDVESLYSLQADHRLAQQRLIKALLDAARQRVLVITLWDVHLAPLTAWQFIHFFSESLIEKRILLLLTLRHDGRELHQEQPPVYEDVLQRMNREGLIKKMPLERFTEAETRLMIHKRLKRTDFSSQFVNNLHQVAGGLPGKIVQLLQLTHQKGIIYNQKGVWFDREGANKELLIELMNQEDHLPNFGEVWDKLNEFQRSILEYGSLFEDTFNYQVLANALQKPRVKTLKELVRLQQLKILINVQDETYQFKFPTVAARIREQLSADTQKEMHKQIALSLKDNPELENADKIPLLAYHFSKTDELNEAFFYLRDAGNLAMQNFAFVTARELFDQAVQMSQSLTGIEESQQIEILFKIIWLNRVLGNRENSLQFCAKTLETWCDGQHPELRTQVLIQKGLTYFQLNEWQKAIDCFESCFVEPANDNPFDQAMAHYGLGNVYLEISEYDLAEKHYQQALTFVKPLDVKNFKANLFNNMGIVENIRGNRLRAISLYSNCIPIYKDLGDNFGLARVYTNIGISYAHEKSWEQANKFYGKSLSVSDSMGLVPLKSVTFLNRVLALIALRKFAEAREYNIKAWRLLERLNDKLGMAEYYKNQGILEREDGDPVEARALFTKALTLFDSLHNKLGIAETEYEMALLKLAENDREAMTIWFMRAKENYQNLGLPGKVSEIEEKLSINTIS